MPKVGFPPRSTRTRQSATGPIRVLKLCGFGWLLLGSELAVGNIRNWVVCRRSGFRSLFAIPAGQLSGATRLAANVETWGGFATVCFHCGRLDSGREVSRALLAFSMRGPLQISAYLLPDVRGAVATKRPTRNRWMPTAREFQWSRSRRSNHPGPRDCAS